MKVAPRLRALASAREATEQEESLSTAPQHFVVGGADGSPGKGGRAGAWCLRLSLLQNRLAENCSCNLCP